MNHTETISGIKPFLSNTENSELQYQLKSLKSIQFIPHLYNIGSFITPLRVIIYPFFSPAYRCRRLNLKSGLSASKSPAETVRTVTPQLQNTLLWNFSPPFT